MNKFKKLKFKNEKVKFLLEKFPLAKNSEIALVVKTTNDYVRDMIRENKKDIQIPEVEKVDAP